MYKVINTETGVTIETFNMEEMHDDYTHFAAADAIIADLPGMVQPLVWSNREYFQTTTSGPYKIQKEYDTDKSVWAFGIDDYLISDHMTLEYAKADATPLHHRYAVTAWLDTHHHNMIPLTHD